MKEVCVQELVVSCGPEFRKETLVTEEKMTSCVEPVGAPQLETEEHPESVTEEVEMEVARAGKRAPDFSGMAYVDGNFKKVSLSDYSGKWVVLCFYPGDFTFV